MGKASRIWTTRFPFCSMPKRGIACFHVGERLPKQHIPGIPIHLLAPSPDFSHPLREVYFRRMEVLDELARITH